LCWGKITAFLPQCVAAGKLPSAFLAQIILLPVRFLAISFYLRASAIGVTECNFYLHSQNTNPFLDCQIFIRAYFYIITLRNNDGKDILQVGDGELTSMLLAADLVDKM
jgi:hypothetical protein